VASQVVLLVNGDEEIGSPSSCSLTEREARGSRAAIVLEPAAGLDGKVKTGRKGVGMYRLKVTGRASHAGLDFAEGASAIMEIARQIGRIAELTDLAQGTTVNPGTLSGGTRTNVVAAEAEAGIDVRVASQAEAERVERALRELQPADPRCSLELSGGINRPPMERERNLGIYETARGLAAGLGVDLGETTVGGGSDGNLTSALGVPTLDGMGGVGEGAHAVNESILEHRIPDRIALLARLLAAL
jgi:glutamate carboxypeptidase